MAELQNRFTWSRSRAGMFDTCHYRYYLNYYGSWGGWSWNADPRNRRIYILKQLQSRWMWEVRWCTTPLNGFFTPCERGNP